MRACECLTAMAVRARVVSVSRVTRVCFLMPLKRSNPKTIQRLHYPLHSNTRLVHLTPVPRLSPVLALCLSPLPTLHLIPVPILALGLILILRLILVPILGLGPAPLFVPPSKPTPLILLRASQWIDPPVNLTLQIVHLTLNLASLAITSSKIPPHLPPPSPLPPPPPPPPPPTPPIVLPARPSPLTSGQ